MEVRVLCRDLVCPVPCIVCYVNRDGRKFFMCVFRLNENKLSVFQDGLVIC